MSGAQQPNVLFLMCDQMQGAVLRSESPCITPNFQKLMDRGVRFERAYTPNPICSPARASLMTGLLPHNHNMLWVAHNFADDLGELRKQKPQWGQRLADAGYATGYFGKWHVDKQDRPMDFGWLESHTKSSEQMKALLTKRQAAQNHDYLLHRYINNPPGYDPDRPKLHYAVVRRPPEASPAGVYTELAHRFLDQHMGSDSPWCCMVSTQEPHDPFVCGEEAFRQYDVDALPAPENWKDDLQDRPALYRKAARVYSGMTEREKKEAAACYYASITEIDQLFGTLIDKLDQAGELENTLIVLTSDHGEALGAHGIYCKNIGAFEETYNIPMVLAGPSIAKGKVTDARVGLHDLCPTLCDLTGSQAIDVADSRSFAEILKSPSDHEEEWTTALAEYWGGRYLFTQLVYWEGPWKLVHNGFDFDELYNLDVDPGEMHNLAEDSAYAAQLRTLFHGLWARMHPVGLGGIIKNGQYPILRLAPYGPWDAVHPGD